MLNIIIGHRGTGKSQWLKLLKNFYKKKKLKACFLDLDEEIEKETGQNISQLFEKGESFFRKKEKQVFQKLIKSVPKNKTCFLSVGAGFVFSKKSAWNAITLGRPSDRAGRFFFNRPRLIPSQSPFKEHKNLYKKRNPYYSKQTDEYLIRREHFQRLEDSDLLFVGLKKIKKPYFTLRLNPWDISKNKNKLKTFLEKRMDWGLRFFELNDQTANQSFIQKITKLVPREKILFSSQCSKKFLTVKNKKYWSWDLSLGKPPETAGILSLHNRENKPLSQILKKFSTYKNRHLKLAVEIFNLKELQMGYDWFCEDPKNRSFLPRSKEGRWLWFRQVFGSQMFLHFIKERPYPNSKNIEVLDQAFLSQALPFIKQSRALAGVLGYPIEHSATPAEQNSFFYKKRKIPVVPLSLKAEEMNKSNLKILADLGFVFFAVTSPLKEQAFLSADFCDNTSKELKTANTLIFHKKKWKAFNTDWEGLQKLKKYSNKNTVVWGGGGIKPVLEKILPSALFYSARTRKLLNQKRELNFSKDMKKTKKTLSKTENISPSPQTLIWAVGRNRMEQGCLFPPKHWKPSQIIDINYTEDSPGKEYALKVKAKYINGWAIFKEQAKRQREIFSYLEKQK